MSIFRKTSFKMIEKIPFRRRHENRISLFTAHRMRIREGLPISSPLHLSIMMGEGGSLCEIYPPGGREAGEVTMKRSALPPITRREKVRPSRWSEQAEQGDLKRGRFLRESSSLAASLSQGPVCSLHSAPLLGVRGVPPCLPPSRVPTSRQFNRKT